MGHREGRARAPLVLPNLIECMQVGGGAWDAPLVGAVAEEAVDVGVANGVARALGGLTSNAGGFKSKRGKEASQTCGHWY
jgi:hypothetical protein